MQLTATPANATIPLRFGQWHFWTHAAAATDDPPFDDDPTNQQLVFCLPAVSGDASWVQNYLPLLPHDVYALEYDERISQETMQSMNEYLASEVTRFLEERQATSYSVMGYSMGSALAYGLIQELEEDLQPTVVMFIDSSPAVLYLIKDVPLPDPLPVFDDPEMQRRLNISVKAMNTLSTLAKPAPVEEMTKNPPQLLLAKAQDHQDDRSPVPIPDDYGMSQLSSKAVMRVMKGNHATINTESCGEIAAFLTEFASREDTLP